MELSKELARQAKKNGICNEWYNQLYSLNDKDKMVDMYLKGIDFCLIHNYPSNDFIKEHFGETAEKHGVFVDASVFLGNIKKCVLLGDCSGKLTFDGYNVGRIFVKHNSHLEVDVKDKAFVMIDVFDSATIKINTHDWAKVCVNRYGGFVAQDVTGNSVIKLIEKNRKTY